MALILFGESLPNHAHYLFYRILASVFGILGTWCDSTFNGIHSRYTYVIVYNTVATNLLEYQLKNIYAFSNDHPT